VSLMKIIRLAVKSARNAILEDLTLASEQTGGENPFGDKTLVLDLRAEQEIVRVLSESGTPFAILSEENGTMKTSEKPEYLAVVDPIDGSTNLERGIPLCSVGISVARWAEKVTTDDVELSMIDSLFLNEKYTAIKGKGAYRNGKPIRVAAQRPLSEAIVSYDTKRLWDTVFAEKSRRVLSAVKDMRRSASNLIDLCWTASGSLDAMVDLRDILPIVHVSGTHMVEEAGGVVLDASGKRFCVPIRMDQKMSFVAASCSDIAAQIVARFSERD